MPEEKEMYNSPEFPVDNSEGQVVEHEQPFELTESIESASFDNPEIPSIPSAVENQIEFNPENLLVHSPEGESNVIVPESPRMVEEKSQEVQVLEGLLNHEHKLEDTFDDQEMIFNFNQKD